MKEPCLLFSVFSTILSKALVSGIIIIATLRAEPSIGSCHGPKKVDKVAVYQPKSCSCTAVGVKLTQRVCLVMSVWTFGEQ